MAPIEGKDLEQVRDVLAKHDVEYLFVGKMAAILQGYPDTTQDADLFVDKTAGNGERLTAALKELGFDRWVRAGSRPPGELAGAGRMLSTAELLSTFDVDDMPTEALLFQTGYLTIECPESRGAETFYRLGYPNREVRQSLNRSLLNRRTGDASRPVAHSARLYDLLSVNDFAGLAAL